MENKKVGAVIRELRRDHRLTQKALADILHISDKTVSKSERGLGYPDISIASPLAEALGVDLKYLLLGDITPNDFVGDNMKQTKYYVCPTCNNISLCTGEAEITCCHKKVAQQNLMKATEKERLTVENIEDDWYITSNHPMEKDNYISFVAFATGDSVQLIKQYPEWNMALRIPRRGHGILMWYSKKEGLKYQLL